MRSVLAVVLVSLVGCGSSPADPAPDAAQGADAVPSADSAGPLPITVTVNDGANPRAGVQVVAHDGSGSVVSTTVTDAQGVAMIAAADSITVAAPAVAQVARVLTITAVEPGDQLIVDLADQLIATPVGPLAVQMPPAFPGAMFYRVYAGCDSSASLEPDSVLTLDIDTSCGDPAGTVDLVAFAVDSVNIVIGVSTLLDIDPTVQASVTLPDFSADGFHYFSYGFSDGGLGRISGSDAAFVRDGVVYAQTTLSGNTQRKRWAIPDDVADTIEFDFEVNVGEPDMGFFYRRRQYYGRRLPANTVEETFDLDASLLAPVLDSTTDATDLERPTLSWVRDDEGLPGTGALIRTVIQNAEHDVDWWIMVPSSATSVKLPELPSELADRRPQTSALLPFVLIAESTVYRDYDEFRTTGMRLRFGPRFFGVIDETLRGAIYFPPLQ